MVVIGGIGTIEGPIIGTLLYLRSFLAEFGSPYLILLGGLATATMMVAPKGIWGMSWDVQTYRCFRFAIA